jgi:hypothetical protein
MLKNLKTSAFSCRLPHRDSLAADHRFYHRLASDQVDFPMDKSTKKDREQNQVTEPKGAKKSGDKKNTQIQHQHPDIFLRELLSIQWFLESTEGETWNSAIFQMDRLAAEVDFGRWSDTSICGCQVLLGRRPDRNQFLQSL